MTICYNGLDAVDRYDQTGAANKLFRLGGRR
jgi:hypothetical protein